MQIFKGPYRILFPIGILYLLCGTLLWVTQLIDPGEYPVNFHRFLMLNGFVSSFVAGFLMTAVPKFSRTQTAEKKEVLFFILLTLVGVFVSHQDHQVPGLTISAIQSVTILTFLFRRIFKRQENPPYSFIFIFVGLILWLVSDLAGIFIDPEQFKQLHFEGAIGAIMLGVGSRLIPGILGHVEVVAAQRASYEQPKSLLATVPKHFFVIIFTFVGSYFLREEVGSIIRAIDVLVIGLFYWRLYKKPIEKTALTWCIWSSSWMIILSFLLKAFWRDGMIHANHSFFITGIVLMSLLIATRVLQSHGPKDKTLENSKLLYVVTGLIILSGSTRVSAILMPNGYLSHLAYSAIILTFAVIIWTRKYLGFVTR